jgi:hypothetical protein
MSRSSHAASNVNVVTGTGQGSLVRYIRTWAAVGAALAIVLLAIASVVRGIVYPSGILDLYTILCPPWMALMSITERTTTVDLIWLFAVITGLNTAWYVVLGLAIKASWHLLKRALA